MDRVLGFEVGLGVGAAAQIGVVAVGHKER
jgi:hypothetical protein